MEGTILKRAASIPWAQPTLLGNEQVYVSEALSSSWISGGPFVDRFEAEFAELCGVRHATTAANGTAALHMAFLALGIGPGDEVIVPGFAFMAAANVALHLGARPVFTEVDPLTWCMTANDIEPCLSPKTKLIVPVHTYGNVCAMDEIMRLADRKSIAVLEDAAEAFLSRSQGRIAGTQGTCGTFSFHATKTITTGEGGMVITASQELHDKLFLYRNHGMLRTRYWHEVPGHNFRMTNMQAALGCAQMEKIDLIVTERNRVYAAYQKHLANVPGVALQNFSPDVEPVVWAVAAQLDPQVYPQGRDALMRQLEEGGIETRNGFYAASMMPHLYGAPALPVCEHLARNVISLPTFCALADAEIEFICSVLHGLRK
jgi:perosamine synthetase